MHLVQVQKRLIGSRGRVTRSCTIIMTASGVGRIFLQGVASRVQIPLSAIIRLSSHLYQRAGLGRRGRRRCSTAVGGYTSGLVNLVFGILSLTQLRSKVVGFIMRRCSIIRLYASTELVIRVRARGEAGISFRARPSVLLVSISAGQFVGVLTSILGCPRRDRKLFEIGFVLSHPDRSCLRVGIMGDPVFVATRDRGRFSILRAVGQLCLRAFRNDCRLLRRDNRQVVVVACPIS